MKIRKKRTVAKLPVFHTLKTKIEAVKEINTLIATGLTENKAKHKVAKTLDVHRTTVENWMKLYTKTNTPVINGQKANHVISTNKAFSMHNVTFNTDLGYIKLSLDDIRSVANFAKTNRLI